MAKARRVPPKDAIGWRIAQGRRAPLESDQRWKDLLAGEKRRLARLRRNPGKPQTRG